jgi:hypothetical protein
MSKRGNGRWGDANLVGEMKRRRRQFSSGTQESKWRQGATARGADRRQRRRLLCPEEGDGLVGLEWAKMLVGLARRKTKEKLNRAERSFRLN